MTTFGRLLAATIASVSVSVAGVGIGQASPAHQHQAGRRPVHSRVTWDGYHGVHPGESMRVAARRLHTTVHRFHCGTSTTFEMLDRGYGTFQVLDDGGRSGRVNDLELGTSLGSYHTDGPRHVHSGIKLSVVKKRFGRRLEVDPLEADMKNPDSYYVVGPHGHTLVLRTGWARTPESHGYNPKRVGELALAPSRKVGLAILNGDGVC